MRHLIFVLINSYFVLVHGTVNYCGSKMCEYTDSHTFCQYQPGPSQSCYGYMTSLLSDEEKARVLARVNKRRMEVAYGLHNLPPAGNMLKLRWVEELAREAQRWADQCAPPAKLEQKDTCRDLYSITVGQCVASVVGEAPGLRPETMVDLWFMQKMYYSGNVSDYVANATFKGQVRQGNRDRSVQRLVCNFSPRGPLESLPLWTPGSPASACPQRSQPDAELPALCSYQFGDSEMLGIYKTKVEELEENLLLDIVLELENHKYNKEVGTMDEIYLKKLAVASFETATNNQTCNSQKKRDVAEKLIENDINKNRNYYQIIENDLNTNQYLNNTKKEKNMSKFLGRPESYNIEDLDDTRSENTIADININESTSLKQDVYPDYENTHTQNKVLYPLAFVEESYNGFTTMNFSSQDPANKPIALNTSTYLRNLADEILSNVTVADLYNDNTVDEKVVDDYLDNLDSARELKAAIEKMKHKLTSSNLVHREARHLDNTKSDAELSAEVERNRTLARGPMLNMVFKYIPYLKSYENNFITDPITNKGSEMGTSLDLTIFFTCVNTLF